MEEELEKDMKLKLIVETYMRKATENSTRKYRYGLYECQYCGIHWECLTSNITYNKIKGCGCQKGKHLETHTLSGHIFYNTWNAMTQRCLNINHPNYIDYGGRGITVCEDWLDVATFLKYAEATYPNIEGYTLDRIDNDKGYSPENCRWADKTTQSLNHRKYKSNTSGFVGICWDKPNKNWAASVSFNSKEQRIGSFKTIEEAVQARDNYIIENKLPHKLSTDYQKD